MRILPVTTAAALVLAFGASTAGAFDLTGAWSGKATCKGFADGAKVVLKTEIAAGISQSGRDVNVEFLGFSFLTRAVGIAVADAKKPDKGEAGFVACGNEPDPVFGVTVRTKVSTKPSTGKGAIKLIAVVAGKDLNLIGVTDATFTCTGSLKRTTTFDPLIAGCPPPMEIVR
ncbi:MAG: hypothetical protein IT294_12610 [Deltaproteobacteria bacterium]|nr:hypothetical protein [Deltaproteobacteria bacterium]